MPNQNLPSNAADLTLTQLANKGVDFINSQVAAHVFANTAMKNIYQGEIEKGGRGVSQEYSSDTTGSSINIIRPLPLPIKARELGAAINGGNFSAYDYQPSSDAYSLKVITVIDDIVDIPNVSLDMIPVGVAEMYIKNVSDKVTLNVNAIKIASALYTSLSAHQVDPTSAYVTTFGSGDNLVKQLSKTYVQLDKGDRTHGVSMFPQDDRIGLVSVDWYAEIISANGVFNLGGANYAYDILRKGTISQNAEQDKLADGYVGDMFGIPFHTVSPLVFATACDYLGFPENEFDADLIALVKSAHGNLFALASGSSIKTIDSPLGQGVRLQPLYRMGAACVMAKSNSLLVKDTFSNPYGLKAIFTSGVEWGYKAPGSRPEITLTTTMAATKSIKLDASITTGGSIVGNAYVQADAGIETVGAFLAAYNAGGAVKGSVTIGTAKTDSNLTVGKVVTFLVVAADGTVALAHDTVA